MERLRIGIIGARRRHQGLGEHVARHLGELGAEIPAILGTSPETVAQAQLQLAERAGLKVRGYSDLHAFFKHEQLDAVAICSPYRCHVEHLQAAYEANVSVLVEKPLVYGDEDDLLPTARGLLEAFAARNLLLMVNEQLPYGLPSWRKLFQDAPAETEPPAATLLQMMLCPHSWGVQMIPDVLPHVGSVLFTVAPPGGELGRIYAEPLARHEGQVSRWSIRFDYEHAVGKTQVEVVLASTIAQPRPQILGIDGKVAKRVIRAIDYRMEWEMLPAGPLLRDPVEADARAELPPRGPRGPYPDPLKLLLADFLVQLRAPKLSFPVERVWQNLQLVREVELAARSHL